MATEIATLFARIGADITGLQTGLASARAALTGAGSQMASMGMQMTAAISLPLAGIGVAAGKAATDFDAQMRNIQSISKQSDADIAALGERFIQMSTDLTKTRDSATGLADGFYQIQSAGFYGENAMTVLEASTKAASAGLTNTATSVKAITAVLNAYGLEAGEATRVSDVLFRAVDIGIFDFQGIAGAIGDTLGAAAAAQVPIEELAAAFATITKAGISVDEAATSINQLMLSYISPSQQAKEAAAALGIELSANALQAKGLSGVIGELAQYTKLWSVVATNADAPLQQQLAAVEANTEALDRWKLSLQATGKWSKEAREQYEQQSAALRLQTGDVKAAMESNVDYTTVMNKMAEKTGLTVGQLAELFPNVRALRAALALTREGGEAFTQDLESIRNAAGATGQAFEIQTKSWAAQWDNFKNVATAALITLGAVIMPTVTGFLQGSVVPLINGLRQLSPEWINWAVAIGAVLIAVGPVLTVVGWLTAALGMLLSPIGVVIALLAVLAIAFATNFGGIRDSAAGVIQPIVEAAKTLGQAFGDSLPMVQGSVNDMLLYMATAWNQYGPALVGNVASTLTTLAQFWRDHGQQIMTGLSFAFRVVVQIVGGALLLLTTVLQIGLLAVNGIFDFFTALLQGNWAGAWNAILLTLINIGFAIINFCMTFVNAVLSITGTNLEQFRATWFFIFQSIWTIVTTVWNNIITWLTGGLAAWGAVWEMGKVIVATVWKNIQDTIAAYVMRATGDIQQFVIDVVNFFSGLVTSIQGAFALDWGAIGANIIAGIKGGVESAAGGLAQEAANAANAALTAAKNALGIRSPSARFKKEVGRQIPAGMAEGIWEAMALPLNALQRATPAMLGAVSGVGGGGGPTINIYNPVVRSDDDIQALAYRVVQELKRRNS